MAETTTVTAKNKKSKKKKSKNKEAASNGLEIAGDEVEGDEVEEDDHKLSADENTTSTNGTTDNGVETLKAVIPGDKNPNGVIKNEITNVPEGDPSERLAAAVREREQLRNEVTELRKSLESIQQKHEQDVTALKGQLEQTQSGKDHAEGRYQKLLGQVNTIKNQLGERLKADAEELSQARGQIEDLEKQIEQTRQDKEAAQKELQESRDRAAEQEAEVVDLRSRASLSQQNWARERDEMIIQEARLREDYETARNSRQDWQVLATEERSQREGLSDRIAELQDQLEVLQESHNQITAERGEQTESVDRLQRALQEIQETRRQELRDLVEASQAQLEELRKQLKVAEEASASAQASLETTQSELERALPFEREVREKNLLIGKLRHEAVILNDHLTKALRFLKRARPDDTVDRQLVTNHFLHFLALDRSDPKKFQVLQLIAALLGWTDEASGISRPGASSQLVNPAQSSSLRVPLAPFRRSSSSTSLASPRSPSATMNLNSIFSAPGTFNPDSAESPMSGNRSDSLAELWSNFLEREALEGTSRPSVSRRTSISTNPGGATPLTREKRKELAIREDGSEG